MSLKRKQNLLSISVDELVLADILWSINLKCLYLLIKTLKTHKVIHFFDQHVLRYVFLSFMKLYFFLPLFEVLIAEIFKPKASCLSFVHSIRNRDFQLYKTTINLFLPWFFTLDRRNYTRWLSVHLCDMIQLQETNHNVFL